MTAVNAPLPLARLQYDVPINSPLATGINNLGTVSEQVIGGNQNRKSITFMNPSGSNVNVLIAPGNITPSFAAPGGSFLLFPGNEITLPPPGMTLSVNCAFNAVASGGSGNPLTIFEYF